nr:Chain C, NP418 epitope from 1972 influenza strain [synthetic construct]
LPFDKSTIM